MEIEHKTYTPSIIELYYFRIATEDVNGKINVFSIYTLVDFRHDQALMTSIYQSGCRTSIVEKL